MLDAAQLEEQAAAQTGLADFGPPTYRDGLARLVDGLAEEAELNAIGEVMAPQVLVGYLANRLEITDWHGRHPEAAATDITPPVVLIGMGRTGTTILHDLLGQDPANRVPRTWEVDRPCPPPEPGADDDPRIAVSQAQIDQLDALHPEFQAMHPAGPHLAQECIRITGGEFASLIFLSQFRLPTYLTWLTDEADLAPAYRWHRRVLQLLQWRDRRDRWILKSGAHLWSLPALVAEYPDAWFIQTHRDPLRVVASLSSLFATVRRTGSDAVSIAQVADDWTDPILDALDRSVTARQDGTIPPDRVIDVPYPAFVADPVATIRQVYDRWGVELTPDAEAAMRAFLAGHGQHQHGVHRYRFADTGQSADRIRARSARYRAFFDVPEEPLAG